MNFPTALLSGILLLVPAAVVGAPNDAVDEQLPLTVHMTWHIGDLGSTIDLRFEMDNVHEGILEAEERTSGDYLVARGAIYLSEDDIARLLAEEKRADLWKLPAHMPPAEAPPANKKGIESVLICYSSFNLAERRHGLMKAIERDCQEDEGSLSVEAFAHEMIRVAQRHFPDIGKSRWWQNELNGTISRH